MRCVYRGVFWLGTLLSISLCSFEDIQLQVYESIQRDEFGNPKKLIIQVTGSSLPVIDGMHMIHDEQEITASYEYDIDHDGVVGKAEKSSVVLQNSKIDRIKFDDVQYQTHHIETKQSGFYYSVKLVDQESGFFESMNNEQLVQYLVYNNYCKKMYGMDYCAKQKLLSLKSSKFKDQVLQNQKLSNQAVLQLLQEYLQGCSNPNKEKYQNLKKALQEEVKAREHKREQSIKDAIEQEVQQRRTVEQEKLQRQKVLRSECIRKQHELAQKEFDCLQLSDELQKLRDRALEQSKQTEYEQYVQQYDLNVLVRGYLQGKGIACQLYEQCYGTALQQQYHQELCGTLQQLAQQELQLKRRGYLFDHACDFVQAAHEAIGKIWLPVAGALSWKAQRLTDAGIDICNRPGEYARAVGQGVVDSVQDFGHMVLHPIESLQGLGQIAWYVLTTAALFAGNEEAIDDPAIKQMQEERLMQIQQGVQALKKQLVDLDGPGRVQAITKVASDFYVPAKITYACAHLLSGVCTRARHARTLEGAASMMGEECTLAEVFEEVVAGAEQVEAAAEQGVGKQALAEFMEVEQQIAKSVAIVPRPLKVLGDEIKTKFGGVIPTHCRELYSEFKIALKQLEIQLKGSNLKSLDKSYFKRTVDGKRVELALDHICNFELSLERSNQFGGYIVHVGGGHMSGIYEVLQKEGLVTILGKQQLSGGTVDYVLQNALTGKKFKNHKTVFPIGWTEEKIAEAVWSIYEDKSLNIDSLRGNSFSKVGLFEEVKIRIIWSEKGKNKQIFDYINTAYVEK